MADFGYFELRNFRLLIQFENTWRKSGKSELTLDQELMLLFMQSEQKVKSRSD